MQNLKVFEGSLRLAQKCANLFPEFNWQAVKVLSLLVFIDFQSIWRVEWALFLCEKIGGACNMANITQEFDTIAAISTPPGEGAISIVR